MLQQATIAAVTAHRPGLVIADEPTSALDAELREDLALVAAHADHVAVCYAGRIVETGPAATVLRTPRHPHTVALLAAVPRPGQVSPGRSPAHLQTWPTHQPAAAAPSPDITAWLAAHVALSTLAILLRVTRR